MKKLNENKGIGPSKSDESKSKWLADFKCNIEMGIFSKKTSQRDTQKLNIIMILNPTNGTLI